MLIEHWPSFWMGVLAMAGTSFCVSGLVLGGPMLLDWLRRRRGAESRAERASAPWLDAKDIRAIRLRLARPGPLTDAQVDEAARIVGAYRRDQDEASLSRWDHAAYRRLLREIFAERRITRAPREIPLSPEESQDLWYSISGDKAV